MNRPESRAAPRAVAARRAEAGIAAALSAVLALSACTASDARPLTVQLADSAPDTTVIAADGLGSVSTALSSILISAADIAIVVEEEDAETFAPFAADVRIPLLIGTGDDVAQELDRLGAQALITAEGSELQVLADGRDVHEVDLDGWSAADGLPGGLPDWELDDEPAPASVVVDGEAPTDADPVILALAAAAGAPVTEINGADPRATGAAVAAAQAAVDHVGGPAQGLIAVGEGFGTVEGFTDRMTTAVTVPELPGGGQLLFPGRRMIAAYGSPGVPSLGILGEQDLPEAIERVRALAQEYEPHTDVPIVPAFEVIATVASDSPGADGDYSNERDIDMLREWVDEAGRAGVYIVLDLQPGTTDFLTQAQLYEELLLEPHVGLALDPEWRLEPGQRHMEQIGSVPAAEINEVSDWLAQLTADNGLPQKLLILHQFSMGMISDREDVDVSHPELEIVLHADGNGTPSMKMATWERLQEGLPTGIRMAWKNFYDEDTPMFTPQQTFELDPRPWFVSYQ